MTRSSEDPLRRASSKAQGCTASVLVFRVQSPRPPGSQSYGLPHQPTDVRGSWSTSASDAGSRRHHRCAFNNHDNVSTSEDVHFTTSISREVTHCAECNSTSGAKATQLQIVSFLAYQHNLPLEGVVLHGK